MLMKILVPLDGSEIGELALVYAKELAIGIDLEVRVAFASERHDQETLRTSGLYLDKAAERLQIQIKRGNPRSEIRTAITSGEPADAIAEYAEQNGIDLIIMMSHGRSGVMPWAMGGTANKLIQTSNVPILMVR